jgi:hypothetical protein
MSRWLSLRGSGCAGRARALPAVRLGIAAALALAGVFAQATAHADSCAGVCAQPEQVTACTNESPVWGFREPDGVCRGGSFGYLESRETADAERLRLARTVKGRCDAAGDCARFDALDRAELVCLACDPAAAPAVSAAPDAASASARGKAPPCEEDEWLQGGAGDQPGRCFVEFVGLRAEVAARGRCVEGDCRTGLGVVEWPGGASYSGRFAAGRRDGQGTFRWPDGNQYVGEWRDGQPSGLGTRIFANGRYKAGYFDRGRYLGMDIQNLPAASDPPRVGPPSAPVTLASCEEACSEDAELRLGRINDEYECCYARHAFCVQKAEVARAACAERNCAERASRLRDDCDIRYACEAVQKEKIARFRSGAASCVEGCSSQDLGDQGLRVSERGTLYDD